MRIINTAIIIITSCTRRYAPGQLGASLFRIHRQKGSWRNGRHSRYSTQTSPFNRDRIHDPPPPPPKPVPDRSVQVAAGRYITQYSPFNRDRIHDPPPPPKPVPDRSVQVAVSIHVDRSGCPGVTQVQQFCRPALIGQESLNMGPSWKIQLL